MSQGKNYSLYSICYLDEQNREYFSTTLYKTSLYYFEKTFIFQNYDAINEWLKWLSIPGDPWEKPMISNRIINEFLSEILLDSIKMIICFEHYLKSILLESGFLIHNIRPLAEDTSNFEKFKKLKDKIRQSPIKIDHYLSEETFTFNPIENAYTLQNLSPNTLQISTLLNNESYKKKFGLPEEIIKILVSINAKRNQLHFNVFNSLTSNKIEEWLKITNFYKTEILPNISKKNKKIIGSYN